MFKRALLLTILLVSLHALVCAAQTPTPTQTTAAQGTTGTDANALYEAKNWPEAARAYEAITRTDPNNGRAWFRLGMSLYSMNKYEQAAAAFEHASQILSIPGAMYNAAASYARLGNKAKALEWLQKAAAAGFSQPDQLSGDADFASLHGDAEFAVVVKNAGINAAPCTSIPDYRQFDFWVGEWDVRGPQGSPPASSSIQSIVSQCVVFENYTQGTYTGKSFSYYDATINKWRQTWVDNSGGSAYFIGEYRDGAMRFEGESHPRQGKPTKIRMTLFNLGQDRVRQLGETSPDDGQTWNVTYDLTYTRRR
ncbi:MAG TPA: tetratricopeptide repeat protein [Pyrinomonadaceae bacterium]|nr:tetratricopeptide repeat protein [Pyrinomonadaceae bacterium]